MPHDTNKVAKVSLTLRRVEALIRRFPHLCDYVNGLIEQVEWSAWARTGQSQMEQLIPVSSNAPVARTLPSQTVEERIEINGRL